MHRINSQLGAPPNKKGGPLRPPPNGLERDYAFHTPNGPMQQEAGTNELLADQVRANPPHTPPRQAFGSLIGSHVLGCCCLPRSARRNYPENQAAWTLGD
jgi:hypothetical protein